VPRHRRYPAEPESAEGRSTAQSRTTVRVWRASARLPQPGRHDGSPATRQAAPRWGLARRAVHLQWELARAYLGSTYGGEGKMRRVLLECAVLVVAFAVTVPTAARAGEMLSGVRWVYRAEVHDLTRDVPSTTEVEVLSFVGADGLQGWVVTTMTEWATTLAVLPRDPEDEGNPDVTGPPHALLRWPTALDTFVPELRGRSAPPVHFYASPALRVSEFQVEISSREMLPDGTTQSGAARLALGLRGATTVAGGTFHDLYATTYSATWWGTSHHGEAWWAAENGAAGPADIPVMARGTVDAILQYTWELTGHELLEAGAFVARLSQALQETAKTDPVKAQEALRDLGILVP